MVGSAFVVGSLTAAGVGDGVIVVGSFLLVHGFEVTTSGLATEFFGSAAQRFGLLALATTTFFDTRTGAFLAYGLEGFAYGLAIGMAR